MLPFFSAPPSKKLCERAATGLFRVLKPSPGRHLGLGLAPLTAPSRARGFTTECRSLICRLNPLQIHSVCKPVEEECYVVLYYIVFEHVWKKNQGTRTCQVQYPLFFYQCIFFCLQISVLSHWDVSAFVYYLFYTTNIYVDILYFSPCLVPLRPTSIPSIFSFVVAEVSY